MDKTKLLGLMMGAVMAPFDSIGVKRRHRGKRKAKPCLNCGKPTDHKAGFCSAKCNREYNSEVHP